MTALSVVPNMLFVQSLISTRFPLTICISPPLECSEAAVTFQTVDVEDTSSAKFEFSV